MNSFFRYFDITTQVAAIPAAAVKIHWLPQWLALFLGIIVQPYFAHYQATHKWELTGLPGWFVFSLIAATLIFPGIYRNSFDAEKPWVIQVIPIFASGMGWQSLLSTAVAQINTN
jgi:hypothetical protein